MRFERSGPMFPPCDCTLWHLKQDACSPKNTFRPRAQLPPSSSFGGGTTTGFARSAFVSAHGTSARRRVRGRERSSSEVEYQTLSEAASTSLGKRIVTG